MECPCRGCEKREPGCHGKCEGYKEFDRQQKEERIKRYKRKRMEQLKR